MKQLLTGVLMSALISISLAGCTFAGITEPAQTDEPTEPKETVETEEAAEMKTLTNTSANFSLEYPEDMHMDVNTMPWNEPIIIVEFGNEYYETGALKRLILIRAERDDYEEYMAENADGPYFPTKNACEDETFAGVAFDCKEISKTVTRYKMVERMGDIGLVQKYYIENPDSNWPVLEMKVDLLTDDFLDQFSAFEYDNMEQAFRDGPITPQQQERLDVFEAMYDSLKLK